MNKSEVIRHLTSLISHRFRGTSERDIEKELMDEGWSIGAIRESIDAVAQARKVPMRELT